MLSGSNELLNILPGKAAYKQFWAEQFADPEFAAIYAEEAAAMERWLAEKDGGFNSDGSDD